MLTSSILTPRPRVAPPTLPLICTEGSLLELGYGLALAQATEVPAIRGAARVLGVLLCELREVPAILQLLLHVLGLLFLVLVEEDVPDAPLLGGHELGLFVLLVVILDLFVGRLRVAGHPLLYFLDREVLADILAQLFLRNVVLLQGLLVGLLVAHVLSGGAGLVAYLLFELRELLVDLFVRDRYVVLLGVGLGYLDADELGHDLLYGGLVLRIVFGYTALLGELIQLPLRDVAALEGHHFPGLRVDIGDRLGRIAAHPDEYDDP